MVDFPQSSGVLQRPAVPPPIRKRRSVLSLPANDPIIVFYEKAIKRMIALDIRIPTSWRYQAAIHEYVDLKLDPKRTGDPLADPKDVLPSASDQATFWSQCQHFSWFFLPWHRMYLHHFERIIMGHVAALNGPLDWALPYWNYSASAAARLFPIPFRSPTLADGTRNHLFVAQRDPDANKGNDFVKPPSQTDIVRALNQTVFSAPVGSASFGGPPSRAAHTGPGIGSLEGTPHGSMHVAISGPNPNGFMGDFVKAPLDPIFWLHHCNLDRLWDVWLQRNVTPKHQNPKEPAWLNTPFPFHDASATAVSMTTAQVLDTKASPLEYVYDDTTDPLSSTP